MDSYEHELLIALNSLSSGNFSYRLQENDSKCNGKIVQAFNGLAHKNEFLYNVRTLA